MTAWIIICLVLSAMVVVLFLLLNRKAIEMAVIRKREERAWTLKVALEKTFKLPTVEAEELARIEPQLDRIMNSNAADAETEEQMRLAVMELYAQKAENKSAKKV